MMHGRGKSDTVVVAGKPMNKAERSAAELVEPRAETKGKASQQSTCRAQYPGKRVTGVGRIRQATSVGWRQNPRWEPGAGKPHAGICAGGARQLASLPRHATELA
jgi:type II secretory pathway component PulJ